MPHPALSSNSVAVVTGGASGIGLAAAKMFARLGLRLCIADLGEERLAAAGSAVSAVATGGAAHVMTVATDVSRFDEVTRLEAAVRERFGGTDVLMNNAGVQSGSAMFGPRENWERVAIADVTDRRGRCGDRVLGQCRTLNSHAATFHE